MKEHDFLKDLLRYNTGENSRSKKVSMPLSFCGLGTDEEAVIAEEASKDS